MADRLPNRPPRTNWGNLSKNLALWLLVGLLALALFQMMSRQRNPTQEFSYTEFSKQLDDANVPILAKEPKRGITAIIIGALLWIVILGLGFFLLRQLQAGGSR